MTEKDYPLKFVLPLVSQDAPVDISLQFFRAQKATI